MRVKYHKLAPAEYIRFYAQAGSGDLAFRGARFQRGGGIGSFFANIFRHVRPLLKPALKSLGRSVLSTGSKIISDVTTGRDPKEALKARLRESGSDILSQAANKLRGQGRKGIKRRKKIKQLRSAKRSRRDIFGF